MDAINIHQVSRNGRNSIAFFQKSTFLCAKEIECDAIVRVWKETIEKSHFLDKFRLFPFFASLPEIYEDLCRTIIETDHKNDLEWWLNNHEFNMHIKKPIFVECVLEEARDASTGTVASAGDVDWYNRILQALNFSIFPCKSQKPTSNGLLLALFSISVYYGKCFNVVCFNYISI